MKLKNIYWGMRHGKSVANEQGIIISDYESGRLREYALTESGREGVLDSAKNFPRNGSDTLIIYSDFSRTVETANLVETVIKARGPFLAWHLRERYFGVYEKSSSDNYQKVWNKDKRNPDYHGHKGESVHDVLSRLLLLISLTEGHFSGKTVLLVSHCDPLKILECWFRGMNPRLHRSIPELKNAEIRRLSL